MRMDRWLVIDGDDGAVRGLFYKTTPHAWALSMGFITLTHTDTPHLLKNVIFVR